MTVNRLCSVIEKDNYQRIQIDIANINLYSKIEDAIHSENMEEDLKKSIYLVMVVDLEEAIFTKDQYTNLINQVQWSFYNKGFHIVELLGVLCVENGNDAKELCLDYDEHWIIEVGTNRVIIYENQAGTFLNMRELIDIAMKPVSLRLLPLATLVIIGLNFIVFILVEMTGGSLDINHMLEWGAMYEPYIIQKGQIYRLITHMFLHFGMEHLANNMIVLFFIGNRLEKMVGKVKYLIIYLGTGIFAGVFSMIYNMIQETQPVSAGASGAIFGVVGAITYIVILHKGHVRDLSMRQLLFFIALSLYSGLTSKGVDIMAHIGGFITGFLFSIILYRKPKEHQNQKIKTNL